MENQHEPDHDTERYRAAMQVDAFMEILAKRHGITFDELVDAARWVRRQRDFSEKMRAFGFTTVIGALVMAMLVVTWEGVKAYLRRP